jgi:hypothetical protein
MNLGARHRQPRSNIHIISNIIGDSSVVYTAFRSKAVTISQQAVILTVENPARQTEVIYSSFNFNFI